MLSFFMVLKHGIYARQILEVPSTTHRNLFPGLVGRLSALEQIYCRFIKMVQTMLKSANVKVKFIYEKALLDVNSIIYSNLTLISKGIGCSIEQLLNDSIVQTKRCLYKRYAASSWSD